MRLLRRGYSAICNEGLLSTPSRRLVLVVDDDIDVREVVADVLVAEGYGVVTAADGREALDWLRGAPEVPCLILLDLMMPRMDGTEFRREQLRDPALREIPVVVLSAGASVVAAASSLRAAAHLRKPMPLDELLRIVRTHAA
jgi:CheY-like chemotaxis protein